ncbi:UNVERIFIED_CONTAM: hypothetical protein K2H54_053872 [Gekko kuhli]
MEHIIQVIGFSIFRTNKTRISIPIIQESSAIKTGGPSSVPHSSGYEVLIQKFLSLYGDQLDMHRKFVVQLFSEEWSQYIDLPKGFLVNERCKVRLVPLQIQTGYHEIEEGENHLIMEW